MPDDLDEIAEQNSPYGNDGTRKPGGAKRNSRRGSTAGKAIAKPKWKNQLRAFKIQEKKRIK